MLKPCIKYISKPLRKYVYIPDVWPHTLVTRCISVPDTIHSPVVLGESKGMELNKLKKCRTFSFRFTWRIKNLLVEIPC